MFETTEIYQFNGLRLKYKYSTECYVFFDKRKFKIGSSTYKQIKIFKPSQEDEIEKLKTQLKIAADELRQLKIHKFQVEDFEAINNYINDTDASLESILYRTNARTRNKYFDSFYKKRSARNYAAHPNVAQIKTDREFLERILKKPNINIKDGRSALRVKNVKF